jgi:hypothetical protein
VVICEQTKAPGAMLGGPVHLMKQMAHSVLCTTFYVLWYVVLKIFSTNNIHETYLFFEKNHFLK